MSKEEIFELMRKNPAFFWQHQKGISQELEECYFIKLMKTELSFIQV